MQSDLIEHYRKAKKFLMENGHSKEIEITQSRKFEDCTADDFVWEYVWVVLNAGMKNQVAEKIYTKLIDSRDINTVGHEGKRKAIQKAFRESEDWFKQLHRADDKLAYLESLHWIGHITKYHLARNIGLDYAKPDRHLVRLAERFGYEKETVQEMCQYISEQTNDRIGVVDVVLWRYCNLGEPRTNNTLIPRSKQTTLDVEN
jgi:thermostable 8-oxoguanine DNA glycosylase